MRSTGRYKWRLYFSCLSSSNSRSSCWLTAAKTQASLRVRGGYLYLDIDGSLAKCQAVAICPSYVPHTNTHKYGWGGDSGSLCDSFSMQKVDYPWRSAPYTELPCKKKKKKVIYTRETPSRLYKSSHSLPFRPAYREEPYGYQMSYQHSGSDGS